MNRHTCLKQLSATQFAMWELHLYMDTHPWDVHALALYKKYHAKYMAMLQEYEDKFGPLTSEHAQGVEWLKNPWPWDIEGCD